MAAQLDLVIQRMAEMETNLVEIETEYDAVLADNLAKAETITQLQAEIVTLNETLANFGTVEQFDQAMQPVRDHIQVLKDKQ